MHKNTLMSCHIQCICSCNHKLHVHYFPLLFIILFLFFSSSAYSRRMIQEYELYYRDQSGKIIIDAYKFNVVVTTYEVLLCKPHPLTTLYTHFNLHICCT